MMIVVEVVMLFGWNYSSLLVVPESKLGSGFEQNAGSIESLFPAGVQKVACVEQR